MNKKKRTWIYVVIAVVVIGYIVIINTKSPGTNTNSNPGNNNSNDSITVPFVPIPLASGNSNLTKNNYTASYPLDWQTSKLDDPNDIVFMFITGNYNTINVSSQTQVAKVTLTGTGNKVVICAGNYQQPEIAKVGVNNQVSYIIC